VYERFEDEVFDELAREYDAGYDEGLYSDLGFEEDGFEEEYIDEVIDEALDEAIRRPAIAGGQQGAVRTTLSPWLRLLGNARSALRNALAAWNSSNINRFLSALNQAEANLQNAGVEIRRITSGTRQVDVLDALSNAVIRVRAAREQARGGSLFVPGGRSLIGPEVSLQAALGNVQQARAAIGLQ
jgi:hypothetical protein